MHATCSRIKETIRSVFQIVFRKIDLWQSCYLIKLTIRHTLTLVFLSMFFIFKIGFLARNSAHTKNTFSSDSKVLSSSSKGVFGSYGR